MISSHKYEIIFYMKTEIIDLSQDQEKVLKKVISWYKSKDKLQFITLGGYAGTGKTTLISILRKKLHEENKDLHVAFCSYTGKATRVLQQKLIGTKGLQKDDTISTIHGLIYTAIENEKQIIVGWKLKSGLKCNLIIIDEASMIDLDIWKDLLSYNIRIIAVGDHGQLPPIKKNFNLMEKPMIKLEKIHRQARRNPIIKLSIWAREKGVIPPGNFGDNVMKIQRNEIDSQETVSDLLASYNSETLILCGYNKTRIKVNSFVRSSLGFESPTPQVNDRVICLRNNHEEQIFNGMIGTIKSISQKDKKWYKATIDMDDERKDYSGLISISQFDNPVSMNFSKHRAKIVEGDLFDFGYALTVHKAQGSQKKRVILFEERFSRMDNDMWKRWLYTAVTRAEEELFVIGQ